MEQKKGNIHKILVSLLTVLCIGVAGFLIYTQLQKDTDVSKTQPENQEVKEESFWNKVLPEQDDTKEDQSDWHKTEEKKTKRITLEEVKTIIANNTDVRQMNAQIETIHGGPDAYAGSGIVHNLYWFDNEGHEFIKTTEYSIVYVRFEDGVEVAYEDLLPPSKFEINGKKKLELPPEENIDGMIEEFTKLTVEMDEYEEPGEEYEVVGQEEFAVDELNEMAKDIGVLKAKKVIMKDGSAVVFMAWDRVVSEEAFAAYEMKMNQLMMEKYNLDSIKVTISKEFSHIIFSDDPGVAGMVLSAEVRWYEK